MSRRSAEIWLQFRGDAPALGALVLLGALAVVALFAPWVAPYDPDAVDFADRFATPSLAHWLGTDDLGRDLLSRLFYGTRVSLRASFQVVITALTFSIPIGLVAGYLGGRVDDLLMRVMDAVQSFPPLILAIAVAGILGPGLANLMLAISILFIPGFARVIRAQTLAVRQETFIEASIVAGTRTREILRRRVLPNVASPLIVQASLALGVALLAEAGLSFLGLGLQPPSASWGSMLRRAHQFIFTDPYQMLVPGLAIASTVLAFNTVGDGLRDALGVASSARRRAGGVLGLTPTHSPLLATTGAAERAEEPLLRVSGLTIELTTAGEPVKVVEELDLTLARGEILGLVGESGAGKTMTALGIMRLIPAGFGRVAAGAVHFEGRDLLALPFSEMRHVRGREIAMIFQDPMSSLNPVYAIGNQIAEAVMLHEGASRAVAKRRAIEMLDRVGIPEARRRMDQYPHQFSGGMRQRAMLAMALACRPKLLIADEPTTALDVTIQAQILDLLRSLQREFGLAVLFVTHDLGVVADVCDRVAVMYAGQLVEQAPLDPFFERPRHPYSEGLLAAMPRMSGSDGALYTIPGQVPAAGTAPAGCRFLPRCRHARESCRPDTALDAVALASVERGGQVRCLRHAELELGGSA